MQQAIRVLCIGDVVGKPGRTAVRRLLPDLIAQHNLHLVLANAENAAGGIGLTNETAKELLSGPIAMLTSGNHIWKHKEVNTLLERDPRVLRPLNFPAGTPGRGYGTCQATTGQTVGVLNLMGRVFMAPLASPFEAAESALAELREKTRIIIVDMHAEATSEKRAMGWFLDGKVSAVFGTHTHVPTADEEILPGGTGYITDIGMTGPYASVIGMRKESVLERFLTMRPSSFAVASGDVRLCGVVFEIDTATGKTIAVEPLRQSFPGSG